MGLAGIPCRGTRIRLRRIVDRGMEFSAPAGLTGTVVKADSETIAVYMDSPLCTNRDWDGDKEYPNCIIWSDTPELAAEFHADCQVIYDITNACASEAIPLMLEVGRKSKGMTDRAEREKIRTEYFVRIAQINRKHLGC